MGQCFSDRSTFPGSLQGWPCFLCSVFRIKFSFAYLQPFTSSHPVLRADWEHTCLREHTKCSHTTLSPLLDPSSPGPGARGLHVAWALTPASQALVLPSLRMTFHPPLATLPSLLTRAFRLHHLHSSVFLSPLHWDPISPSVTYTVLGTSQ